MNQNSIRITFHNTRGLTYFINSQLKYFFLLIIRKEEITSAMNVKIKFIFVPEKEIILLNKKYLHHPYSTDILTFDLSDKKNELDAEIYICTEVVRKNAKRFGVTNKNEFLRVMVHGILHLAGYGDKTKKEQETMRRKEDYYLPFARH